MPTATCPVCAHLSPERVDGVWCGLRFTREVGLGSEGDHGKPEVMGWGYGPVGRALAYHTQGPDVSLGTTSTCDPALGRWRQEGQKFKTIRGYRGRAAWATRDSVSKNKIK